MAQCRSETSTSIRQMEASEVHALHAWREDRLAALDGALAPGRIVKALAFLGLTGADLAVATGAHERTVSSWLDDSRPEPKKKAHQERLRELKRVARFVVDDGTIVYQEADWLRDPNLNADLLTPLQLIGRDEWRRAGRIYCEDVSIPIPRMFQEDEMAGPAGYGITPPRAKA